MTRYRPLLLAILFAASAPQAASTPLLKPSSA